MVDMLLYRVSITVVMLAVSGWRQKRSAPSRAQLIRLPISTLIRAVRRAADVGVDRDPAETALVKGLVSWTPLQGEGNGIYNGERRARDNVWTKVRGSPINGEERRKCRELRMTAWVAVVGRRWKVSAHIHVQKRREYCFESALLFFKFHDKSVKVICQTSSCYAMSSLIKM